MPENRNVVLKRVWHQYVLVTIHATIKSRIAIFNIANVVVAKT